jgi:hypothetical protein
MARWTGLGHTDAVLGAAQQWRDKCLLGDGSLFTGETLWTEANFHQLKQRFVENLLGGSDTFYEKLKKQLGEAEPQVIELAAEAIWLLFLFVSESSVRAETKRERVGQIWKLSGTELPSSALLADDVLKGLANPGTAFLTHIWREARYLFLVLCEWKSLPQDRQNQLLSANDPWPFCEWVTSVEDGSVRAFRHMLLYLCYPEWFERICSRNHKRLIYKAFSGRLSTGSDPYNADRTPCGLDKAIHSIRTSVEQVHQTSKLDFYLEPLRSQWLEKGDERSPDTENRPSSPAQRRFWVEKTIVRDRSDRESGPHSLGLALWSPQKSADGRDIYANMREVRPGDVVYHLTDNEGFTGVSIVERSVDDTFGGLAGTAWGEQASYRIALRDFQRLDPPLTREMFFDDSEIQ